MITSSEIGMTGRLPFLRSRQNFSWSVVRSRKAKASSSTSFRDLKRCGERRVSLPFGEGEHLKGGQGFQ